MEVAILGTSADVPFMVMLLYLELCAAAPRLQFSEEVVHQHWDALDSILVKQLPVGAMNAMKSSLHITMQQQCIDHCVTCMDAVKQVLAATAVGNEINGGWLLLYHT